MADYTIKLELTHAVHGGNAMGKHKGKTYFVPYAIPGEIITAHVVDDHKKFAHAEGVELLKASPDRVAPQCPHYGPGKCGGCQLQHMSYAAQLKFKQDVVFDQLKRIGGIKKPGKFIQPTIPSPEPWGYRSRAAFHVTDDGRLGFYNTESSAIDPVDWCYILDPRAMSLLEVTSLDTTDLKQVRVQIGSDDAGMLILSTKDDLAPSLEADTPVSVNLLLSDNEPVNLIGDSHSYYTVKGRKFQVTAGGFFQVNLGSAETLVDLVMERLDLQGHESVLDLYGGVGLFSAFIAEQASLVTLIESYPPAVTDADVNLSDFENIDLFEGGVAPILQALIEDEEGPYEAAVVDPPRAGLEPQVIDALSTMDVKNLVYVSCDPATLARDIKKLLKLGYTLHSVQPVDMFPQTYHIECVVHLTRAAN